ncbi:MAG: TIGR02117 family protein [Bacteroidota bacterium]|nr:TIGR02117 family protein [Bacteroidota bacterium]
MQYLKQAGVIIRMILLKRSFRYFLYFLLTFILLLSFYLLCAWLFPKISLNASHKQPKEGIEIFVRSNGVHTDLILPVKTRQMNWTAFLPYTDFENVDPRYDFISVGWGDKGFYLDTKTWDDLKFSTAFKAAFGLSGTAMHVSYEKKPREKSSCKRIVLNENQYNRMIRYIGGSFQRNGRKPVPISHPGYSEQDCFYEGTGTYSLFRTCNVWTGNALDCSGLKVGHWTPFDSGVMNSLE